MAHINYPVPDEAIIEYLRLVRGFDNSDGAVTRVGVQTPIATNDKRSSVSVTVEFEVPLSQLQELIKQQE